MLKQQFQKVFVINLDRRTDRLDRFYFDLPVDWPFAKPLRFAAIDGKTEVRPQYWKSGAGAWGCYRTHLSILRHCLDSGSNSVLIMEDDAICIPDFREKCDTFWRELPADAQVVYLGGQHIHMDRRLPQKVSRHVYRPFNVNRTHCYGIRGRKMLEKVYHHLRSAASFNVPHHVDHFLGALHETMDSGLYVPDQWLVTQSGGTSDITHRSFNTRHFEDTDSILHKKLEVPCIALIGLPGSGANVFMQGLRQLGVISDTYKQTSCNRKQKDLYATIAENCFDRTTLKEIIPSQDRIALLRYWAAKLYSNEYSKKNGITHPYFCWFDPLLSMMIPEVVEAWNNPFIFAIDRPSRECLDQIKNDPLYQSHDHLNELLSRMEYAMTSGLEKHATRLFQTSWHEITQLAEMVVEQMCLALQHKPTGTQFDKTVELFQSTEQYLK